MWGEGVEGGRWGTGRITNFMLTAHAAARAASS